MTARALLLAAGLLGLPAVALGQSATDPVATVKTIYDRDDTTDLRLYAKPLRDLLARDRREAEGEIGRLDFAYHINAQDTETGFRKSLRLERSASDDARAEVVARFRNGPKQELHYELVRENGRWLIAEVRSVKGDRWSLVALLKRPLR